MPSAKKQKTKAADLESEQDDDTQSEFLESPPSEIDPYEVLSVSKDATADQIKSAYRKAALRHHPDKASPETKDEAHKKFQEIAFAYAILSDDKRRKRYDTTGNTSESLDDDDFDWVDFFREQKQAMVSGDMIEQIKREYRGSNEEKQDLLSAYEEAEGDMDAVYEQVMLSSILDDDDRFRRIIDEAIEQEQVESYPKYAKETKASRKKRVQKAKAEAAEAEELAEELGVRDRLFGKKASKNGDGEDALKALIQQRQKGRAESFLDNLEAKYGGGKKSKSKRDAAEPPEELFERDAKKSRKKAK